MRDDIWHEIQTIGKLDDWQSGILILVVEVDEKDKWEAKVNDSKNNKKIFLTRYQESLHSAIALDKLHLVSHETWQKMTTRNLYNEM